MSDANTNIAATRAGGLTSTGTLDLGDHTQMAERATMLARRRVSENSLYCQSNQIARASFNGDTTLHSHRLLAVSLAKVDRSAEGTQAVYISREELRLLFPAYAKTNSLGEILDLETNRLMTLMLTSRPADEALLSGNGKKRRRQSFDKINMISRCTYDDGVLRVEFHPDSLPHITGLKRDFMQTRLRYIAQLDSEYQFNLYRFLCSHNQDRKVTVDLAHLRELLQVPKDAYQVFSGFDRRVLIPSVQAINSFTDLRVTYDKEFSGKSISAITFRMTRNTNVKLLPARERALADMMIRYGMNQNAAVECVSVQGFEYALKRYVYTRGKKDEKQITSTGGYLFKLCENPLDPILDDPRRQDLTERAAKLDVAMGAYALLELEQRAALDGLFASKLDDVGRRMFHAFGGEHHTLKGRFCAFMVESLVDSPLIFALQ